LQTLDKELLSHEVIVFSVLHDAAVASSCTSDSGDCAICLGL